MKGERIYRYMGKEIYNELECIKYSLKIIANGIIPENEKGFANITAESTAIQV